MGAGGGGHVKFRSLGATGREGVRAEGGLLALGTWAVAQQPKLGLGPWGSDRMGVGMGRLLGPADTGPCPGWPNGL